MADSIYLFQVAEGTYVEGGLLDLGWPLGALLMGLAAWQPGRAQRAGASDVPSVVMPVALALVSLAILVYDHFDRRATCSRWARHAPRWSRWSCARR